VITMLFGSSPSSQIASQGSGGAEAIIDGLDADQDVVPSFQNETTEARYAVSAFDLSPHTATYISCTCARTGTLNFMHLFT
jgi:hypothetical protein